MRKLLDKTFLKFILVGIVNTLFGTAVMFVFYNVFGLSYWLSSASNYFFGSILSYFLNKRFTFKNKDRSFLVVLKFTLNIAVCYGIAYGVAKPLAAAILSGINVSLSFRKISPCWWACACLWASIIWGSAFSPLQKRRTMR